MQGIECNEVGLIKISVFNWRNKCWIVMPQCLLTIGLCCIIIVSVQKIIVWCVLYWLKWSLLK